MKNFEIWMEGFQATGQSSKAQMIGKGNGMDFDEAVKDFMTKTPQHGIERNKRDRYTNEDAYNNRRSNWSIWGCSLFDNEKDAIKSFG